MGASSGCLVLLLLASFATAEPYALPGAGVTVDLPGGWQMTRYSDWDFNARTETGLALELRTTPWQLPLDPETGRAWATDYAHWLADAGATEVVADTPVRGTIGDREVLRTTLRFQFGGGSRGVAHVAAFPVDGKVAHVMVMAAAPNGLRASHGLETAVARVHVDQPPSDLASLGGTRSTDLGFKVALGSGWRVPLASEADEVKSLAGATGAGKAAACFTAVHPAPADGTSLLLLCKEAWTLGVLDEASATDKGEQLRALLFGKAAAAVPAAEALEVADRTALLFRPPLADYDLRLAVLPYAGGAVHAWAVGPKGGGALEPAVRSTLDGLTWDEGDGMPRYAMGERVFHTIAYRPFHPLVLASAAAVVAVMALVVRLMFRRSHPRPLPH